MTDGRITRQSAQVASENIDVDGRITSQSVQVALVGLQPEARVTRVTAQVAIVNTNIVVRFFDVDIEIVQIEDVAEFAPPAGTGWDFIPIAGSTSDDTVYTDTYEDEY